MMFKPTRKAGLSRLIDFAPAAGGRYARLRNSDFGKGRHDHVSTLSPYIKHRLITEREVVQATLEVHDLRNSEKFVQEVFWRTYFKGWLEHRPHVWSGYQAGLKKSLEVLEKDKSLRANYTQAISGETDIACFDYWVNELIETGYLHNHARMWFASIWIFTLGLDWELGADFFLRHLLDGDAASNTLSWRWVGGLHTKGKTYLARPDNIFKFTDGRFNPQGELAPHAEPLTEPENLMPDAPLFQTESMPQAPYLYLLHEDDMHPESLLQDRKPPRAYIGALATQRRSPLEVSANVKTFTRNALTQRLSELGAGKDVIEGEWAEALLTQCKAHDVKDIVTAYCPVGPSAQVLTEARPALEASGIKVTQLLRPWDRIVWPHANRGFFKVKKKIPSILERLDQEHQQMVLV